LAEICINEAKVAVVPGEAFGAPGFFRMSYALGDEDLAVGVSRLAALFGEAQD
jgi:aspartate/methionine/tyrosine aminotransferase